MSAGGKQTRLRGRKLLPASTTELRLTDAQYDALCNVLVWAELYDRVNGNTNAAVYDLVAEAVPYRD